MSAKKKVWVNSIFSQLANLEKNNSTPEPKHKTRFTRTKSATSIKENANTTERETPISSQKRPRLTRSASIKEIGNEIIDLSAVDSDVENSDEHKIDVNKAAESQTKVKKLATLSNENWIDLFAPSNTEELAIHAKKILELENWFKHCKVMRKKQPAQLCLLTGPSGSGKTAAVRVLANEANFSIQEWINPVDQEVIHHLGDQDFGTGSYARSQVEVFKSFLFKASRYRSLLEAAGPRILLVEDFPNFLLKDPSSFKDILEDYCNYGKSPLIFIVTEAKRKGLNISYNLFTDELKQRMLINHISFNSIASTLMTKAMKRFCQIMRSPPYCDLYKAPAQDIIDSIVVAAQGDIRNALINLHFSSLKGAPRLEMKSVDSAVVSEETSTSTGKARKRKAQNTLKSIGRDESVTMMHALGRVFNPKYCDNKTLLHSPENIAEAFTTEPKSFLDFIHANYLKHFREIDYVLNAANGLSIADLMLNEYREDTMAQMGLNVGIRSVMVSNEKPVSGWMPVKGPKRLNVQLTSKIPLEALSVLPEHHNISSNLYALDYSSFVKRIQN